MTFKKAIAGAMGFSPTPLGRIGTWDDGLLEAAFRSVYADALLDASAAGFVDILGRREAALLAASRVFVHRMDDFPALASCGDGILIHGEQLEALLPIESADDETLLADFHTRARRFLTNCVEEHYSLLGGESAENGGLVPVDDDVLIAALQRQLQKTKSLWALDDILGALQPELNGSGMRARAEALLAMNGTGLAGERGDAIQAMIDVASRTHTSGTGDHLAKMKNLFADLPLLDRALHCDVNSSNIDMLFNAVLDCGSDSPYVAGQLEDTQAFFTSHQSGVLTGRHANLQRYLNDVRGSFMPVGIAEGVELPVRAVRLATQLAGLDRRINNQVDASELADILTGGSSLLGGITITGEWVEALGLALPQKSAELNEMNIVALQKIFSTDQFWPAALSDRFSDLVNNLVTDSSLMARTDFRSLISKAFRFNILKSGDENGRAVTEAINQIKKGEFGAGTPMKLSKQARALLDAVVRVNDVGGNRSTKKTGLATEMAFDLAFFAAQVGCLDAVADGLIDIARKKPEALWGKIKRTPFCVDLELVLDRLACPEVVAEATKDESAIKEHADVLSAIAVRLHDADILDLTDRCSALTQLSGFREIRDRLDLASLAMDGAAMQKPNIRSF